jgi:hypothetical protein
MDDRHPADETGLAGLGPANLSRIDLAERGGFSSMEFDELPPPPPLLRSQSISVSQMRDLAELGLF